MKKLLLSLFGLLTLGLINFSSAGFYTYNGNLSSDGNGFFPFPLVNFENSSNISVSCIIFNDTETYLTYYVYGIDSSSSSFSIDYFDYGENSCSYDGLNCLGTFNFNFSSNQIPIYFELGTDHQSNGNSFSCTFSGDNIINQSDLNGGTGENSWSALYINDIQHNSAGIIDITIPQEFSWDYTGDDEVFELNVIGYNVDTEYIEGIITNQITYPTKEDFNNILDKLIPLFVPGLVVILFLYFVFRFLKKIF